MQTIGLGGSVLWDFDATEQANVDNFNVYLDGDLAKVVPPSERSVPIQDLTTTPGDRIAAVSAVNAAGESSKASVSFRLVIGVPSAPTNVRVGMV